MRWLLASDRAAARPLGGMTVVLLETARRFLQRGDEVVWVTGRLNDSLPDDGDFEGIRVHSFPLGDAPGLPGLLKVPGLLGGRIQRVVDQGVDGAILHQPLAGAAAATPLRGAKVPSIYFFHSPWAREYLAASGGGLLRAPAAAVRRLVERRAARRADSVAVFSRTMGELFRTEHPALPPPARVTPGVDLQRFRPPDDVPALRSRLGWPEEAMVFFTARRLVPRTGVDLLIEAFRTVAGDHPECLLVVAGTGPMERALREQVHRAGLAERVRFAGYLEDDELPAAFGASDAVVMPTRELEGLGLVTLEAMASGTVVAATPVGGNIELVQPFLPGLLAERADASSLAEVLDDLARRGREGLRELGREARDHVAANYGWDRTASDLIGLLEEAR